MLGLKVHKESNRIEKIQALLCNTIYKFNVFLTFIFAENYEEANTIRNATYSALRTPTAARYLARNDTVNNSML